LAASRSWIATLIVVLTCAPTVMVGVPFRPPMMAPSSPTAAVGLSITVPMSPATPDTIAWPRMRTTEPADSSAATALPSASDVR
jgi:hypothetical protein